jgi:tetratricopeptide (TPR) repeat protein
MRGLSVGTVFADRFDIDGIAGTGGMGTVYRARDRVSQGTVALKLLQTLGTDPSEAERFAREAQVLAELRHPSIVSYVAHGLTADGERFLAMEWLDGEDLASRLARGPLSHRDSVLLMQRVAEGLAYAHERGIVHRDIKPSNLFLPGGDIGQVKLLDFGVARRLGSQHNLTHTGRLIGTPEYIAPEQASGGSELTPAADIFSLGCVFYEALTGTPPFRAEHLHGVLVRILFEDPKPIDHLRVGLPSDVRDLVRRMLLKDPERRIPDATALLALLASLGQVHDVPPTLPAGSARLPSFAENEQAVCTMVIASVPIDAVVAKTQGSEVEATPREPLLEALRKLGVRADFLVDGSLVVIVPSTASVTDQVAKAARVALVIKSRWPGAEVALATGRGMTRGTTTVGEVADRAAQLMRRRSVARPEPDSQGGVVLDSLSAQLLGPRFTVTTSKDGAALVGEEREVDATRPLLGKPTPCVGRDAELTMLDVQLTSSIENGEACAILVTAVAGAGKSRLRHEFLRRARARERPPTVLVGNGDIGSAGVPYGMLCDAVRGLAGLSGKEPAEEQRRRVGERIGQRFAGPDREHAVAFFGEMMGLPPPDETPALRSARLDPKLMTDEIRRAVLGWLAAECRAAPLLVVLDDLQWGDALTVGLVVEAVRALQAEPIYLLLLARPEIRQTFPKLLQIPGIHDISLRALGRKACERLIVQVLGKEVGAATMTRIIEHSAGNALFLEEMIRFVAESGHGAEETPETVLAMLQARIGRLEAGPRRAILAAAVYGQTFWRGGVGSVLALSQATSLVDDWFRNLVDEEMIARRPTSRFAGQDEYGFRHALVRDAAYALLTEDDRVTGHRLAGDFLVDQGERDAAAIASHYERGLASDRAAPLYTQAGDEASRLYLHPMARQYYGAALAALERQPASPQIRRRQAELQTKQASVSLISDTSEQNLRRLASAEALLSANLEAAPGSVDPADELLMARVQYVMGRVLYYGGQHAEAIRCYRRALPVGQRLGDPELSAMPAAVVGMALLTQGHMGKAGQYLSGALEPLQKVGNTFEHARARAYLGLVMAATGQYRDGIALIEEVEAQAGEMKQALLVTIARILHALAHRCGMNWPGLLDVVAGVGDAALRDGEKLYAIFGWSLEAWGLMHLGRLEEATRLRARARELEVEIGGRHAISHWFVASDAEAALLGGDHALAVDIARSIVESSAPANLPKSWGIAERVWGVALARAGAPFEECEAHLRESDRVLREGELVLDAAQTQLCWGDVLRARGDEAGGRARIEHALEAFVEAGCDHAMTQARRMLAASPGGACS